MSALFWRVHTRYILLSWSISYIEFLTSTPWIFHVFFFLMTRRPPRSTQSRSSAASYVYKRQVYPYHDKLFRSFLEQWRKTSPAEILLWYSEGTLAEHLGCEADIISEAFPDARSFIADLEHWWKLMHTLAVAKRIQAPPIVSITRRAYGYDHREAQLTPYFPREYHRLKAQLLND